METKSGYFITFEGIDGAGKTTQLRRLAERMQQAGYPIVQTREPGGTAIGDKVREILLSPDNQNMTPRTEALLYAASRAQHVDEVIRPSLNQGFTVLCDRFVDASIAYQGGGLELGEENVARINAFAVNGVLPDLTILFHLSLEESRKRLNQSRGAQLDRIEQRDAAYFSRVEEAFRTIATAHPERVRVIDANRSATEIEQEIWLIVLKHINKIKSNSTGR
ncbi:dTMP kinase [Alicyclobacillus dauci]|uniref:Thymidylate kinase n=1 Tax=Alicyclobacillus dauci TaxID=1475485 RepID=A0ABY6Z337_9BACL|nr:dTMP kinase [Alicyclobacillus dauci]WAH37309.1 dTMP kinase [Alicyclobacillus dauci]